jgi:biopolymer transport protein ExbD
MSHHASSDSEGVVDPNLTPLLDLVLQILMFFIVCVTFVSQQVTNETKLPYSDSAKPIEKADGADSSTIINQIPAGAKVFLNKLRPDQIQRFQNQDSVVLILGMEPKTLLDTKSWLKQQYEDDLKKAELAGEKEVKRVIDIRADGELDLKEVFQLMNFVKAAGYRKLKVRAIVKGGGGA